MRLEIKKVETVAESIRSFELSAADGAALPPFEPGAHLPIHLQLPDGRLLERHYSLLSDPADLSRYRIAVLLERNGRGGSRFMHENLSQGDFLTAGLPRGEFRLVSKAEHSILIAGGIGITPLLSMLRRLGHQGASVEVHFAARRPEAMAFRQEVEDLAGSNAHFYFTRVEKSNPLDVERLLASRSPNSHLYVCGPRGLVLATVRAAERHHFPPQQVHFESFGSPGRPDDRPLQIELEQSGTTLTVQPGTSILDALIEAGAFVSYDCKRGECGSCSTRVIEGNPDHRDFCLTDRDRREFMCTCVSWAHGPMLRLDL